MTPQSAFDAQSGYKLSKNEWLLQITEIHLLG